LQDKTDFSLITSSLLKLKPPGSCPGGFILSVKKELFILVISNPATERDLLQPAVARQRIGDFPRLVLFQRISAGYCRFE